MTPQSPARIVLNTDQEMAMSAGRIDFPCTVELGRGLEGAITNVTRIGHVDGEEGKLILRGYSIEDLCAHASFEEVAHLLLFGELPSGNDLAEFEQKLRESADLPEPVIRLIESMPPDAHPMNVLQSAVAALACYDKECQAVTRHTSDPAKALPVETEVAIRVLARTRTAASAIARARMGKPPLEPVPGLSFTGNYLYMMNGERPDEMTERVMELALIMQADHGMSTSTFTAMVVHSTLSDLYSTIAAAIGSLRGPLHGGAYEAALADLMTIGSPDNVERWVEKRMASGQRIIGFGHRVYRTHDPRVGLLKRRAEALCRRRGLEDLFKTAAKVDKTVCAAMAKKGRKIFPNISFYSGVLYHALGIAPPLFPVVFAVARTAGWLARVLEYLPENRLFCPTAAYAGPADRPYVPIDRR